MIEPKTGEVLKGFVTSGVKEIGNYTYVLLLDLAGQTLIKRVKTDQSEIKFVKRNVGDIVTFWLDPTIHSYIYIHEV